MQFFINHFFDHFNSSTSLCLYTEHRYSLLNLLVTKLSNAFISSTVLTTHVDSKHDQDEIIFLLRVHRRINVVHTRKNTILLHCCSCQSFF